MQIINIIKYKYKTSTLTLPRLATVDDSLKSSLTGRAPSLPA